MTDGDVRQALITICEAIKVQMNLASEINKSVVALSNTVFNNNPSLRKINEEHGVPFADFVARQSTDTPVSGTLQKIDKLMQTMMV
jgi:hypothetical protein